MVRRRATAVAFVAALILASTADAQVLLRVRRPFVVNPPVVVQLGPLGIYGYGIPRVGIAVAPPVLPRPLYAGPIDVIRQRRALAAGYRPSTTTALTPPTTAELSAMEDSALLNVVLQWTAQLNSDLTRFNTGDGWQNHLRLPDDALPPVSAEGRVVLGFKSLANTLARFDAIAVNPQYVQINSLASFAATRGALAEVVTRFGNGPSTPTVEASAELEPPTLPMEIPAAATPPAVQEELPAPAPRLPLLPPQNGDAPQARGERSVLSK